MVSEQKRLLEEDPVIVNFDGLCEPKNPGGVATYGLTIKKEGKTIHQESGLAEADPWSTDASNNVAEYSGIIKGLEWLLKHKLNHSPVIIRGDSRLVIHQLRGTFKVKAPRIVGLYKKSFDLATKFSNIHFEWIERSLNTEADLLSRIAYAKYLKESRKPK